MSRRRWVAALLAAIAVGVPVAIVGDQLGWPLAVVALIGGPAAGCAGVLAAWAVTRERA